MTIDETIGDYVAVQAFQLVHYIPIDLYHSELIYFIYLHNTKGLDSKIVIFQPRVTLNAT